MNHTAERPSYNHAKSGGHLYQNI